MNKRTLTSLVTLVVLAFAPAVAQAADPIVQPNVWADQMTALDGTLVWASGSQLMQRYPNGTVAPVQGAPPVYYQGVDLGRDAQGALVLTYQRCSTATTCVPYADDLAGHRVAIKHLRPKRCALAAGPSMWGHRVAYTLRCSKLHGKPNVPDAKRSGLFVRTDGGLPRRLRLPRKAGTFLVNDPASVDLRGTTVGAVVRNGDSYALTQTVNGHDLRVAKVGASRLKELVTSATLDDATNLWTVTNGSIGEGEDEHVTDSRISRLAAPGCADSESFFSEGYVLPSVSAIAIDGPTMYLAEEHAAQEGTFETITAIVSHAFSPSFTCP